jgi:ElaB/YqjD/DUF883 family membrane-anchored ribosome-binding protein
MVTDDIDTLSTTGGDNATRPPAAGEPGAAEDRGSAASTGGASGFINKAKEEAGTIRDKATDAARGYAETGRNQTADLLSQVAELVQNAAGSIEGQVGERYGGYIRKAADNLTSASETLRGKDIDELVDDARGYIKASPAIAIGAAAAAGFLLARVIRAGQPERDA